MTARPDPLEAIEHDGDRWQVIGKGATRESDGFVYCQLASTTRWPIQVADWIDPEKLVAPLSARVCEGSEAAPWVVDEIVRLEQRAADIAALVEAARKVRSTRDAYKASGSGPHARNLEAHIAAIDELIAALALFGGAS